MDYYTRVSSFSTKLEHELEIVPTPVGSLTAVDDVQPSPDNLNTLPAQSSHSTPLAASSASATPAPFPLAQTNTLSQLSAANENLFESKFMDSSRNDDAIQSKKRSVKFAGDKQLPSPSLSTGGLAPIPNSETVAGLPGNISSDAHLGQSEGSAPYTSVTQGTPLQAEKFSLQVFWLFSLSLPFALVLLFAYKTNESFNSSLF